MEQMSNFPLESQRMEIIGRLATSVIHDLNNLLTLVQLNAALLEQGGVADEEVIEIAGKIGQACTKSSDLTRKVLDLARRRERVQRAFNVGEVVLNHTNLVKTFVSNRADLLVTVREENLWTTGDAGEIEQAILNLILNAADAMTKRGQVRVECQAIGGPNGFDRDFRVRQWQWYFARSSGSDIRTALHYERQWSRHGDGLIHRQTGG